ncbi:MAG: hypothetical protein HUJ31_19245, partial [Pseudomonadales bacterium]|nr:hypothetical protein [Pseudomonadales bacterium]
MRAFKLGLLALALLPGACHTFGGGEKPALLVAPDDETRAELNDAVSGLLDGTPVMLGDDAFTTSSILTLERKRTATIESRAA